MSNNAHELSNRLLNALDNNYNVVDMHAVNEIISILERINITKELLETTRLGKHVNELRRKTSDPTLARRAKVLVKRWRDLVIPAVASPAHTGSNRSSAERQVRRLGGTPLTSPALSRVVSPAVPSPRPLSRPAWGGYESDSQDVILVDDDPPPPPPPHAAPPPPHAPHPAHPAHPAALHHMPHKPLTPPVKRPPVPDPLYDEKKAKRDKKPKKRRGHSRAGSGTETSPGPSPGGAQPPTPAGPVGAVPAGGAVPPGGVGGAGAWGAGGAGAWGARNGAATSRRRNGCRRDALDPYAALATRMPPAGAKKVKTTKELLEQIQSRGSKPTSAPTSPGSPRSPASPDVMLIEPDTCTIKVESPLRNGGSSPRAPAAPPTPPPPLPPLEDEREYSACTCGDEPDERCPAASRAPVRPLHVRALHHVYVPGVNGTRAPLHPHQFAVRKPEHPEWPGLFASVVPLYKYSDYADDYCAKNMDAVPLCTHLPWTEFAPPPPDPPPPPSPPPIRPYPIDFDDVKPKPEPKDEDAEEDDDEAVEGDGVKAEVKTDVDIKAEVDEQVEVDEKPKTDAECAKLEPEMVGVPSLEPSERLKAPILSAEDETQFDADGKRIAGGAPNEGGTGGASLDVQEEFKTEPQEHRTVERTKEEVLDGRLLCALCERARASVRFDYGALRVAPVLSLPMEAGALDAALAAPELAARDELLRPRRAPHFAEWHECTRLGDLVALPYVVID